MLQTDPKSLTTKAGEALAEELRKRGLDSPDAIAKYERERDRQIRQEEQHAAAVRWSKRSRFQRVFDHLKEHPLAALLACVGFPTLAFLIGYGMVTLRVGNDRILSSSCVSNARARWCVWCSGSPFTGYAPDPYLGVSGRARGVLLRVCFPLLGNHRFPITGFVRISPLSS